MTTLFRLFGRGLVRHGVTIVFALATFSVGGLAFFRMIQATQNARTAAVALRKAHAEIDSLRKRTDQHAAVIDRIQADARCRITERLALSETQNAIATHRETVRQQQRRLNEDTLVRTWGDTPLPVDVARLHKRPALIGANAYLDHLPDSQPLLDTRPGTANQR